MDLGESLRAKRKAIGLTQEGVARRSGLTLKHIGEVERGEVQDPHYSTLRDIANALDTSVAELVGEREPVPVGPKADAQPETGLGVEALSAEELRAAALQRAADLKTNRTRASAKAETREDTVARVLNLDSIDAIDKELRRRGEESLEQLIPAYRRWKRAMSAPTEVAEPEAAAEAASEAG